MHTIKVNDTYCEYEFGLDGLNEFSIQDIVDIILEKTNIL